MNHLWPCQSVINYLGTNYIETKNRCNENGGQHEKIKVRSELKVAIWCASSLILANNCCGSQIPRYKKDINHLNCIVIIK